MISVQINAATNILMPHIPTLFAVLYMQGKEKKDILIEWLHSDSEGINWNLYFMWKSLLVRDVVKIVNGFQII